MLQWSPVLETGNTIAYEARLTAGERLQWSPVLETGNTRTIRRLNFGRQSCNGARS